MPKQPKVPKVRFNLKNATRSETLVVLVFRYNRPDKLDYKTGKPENIKMVYSTGEKIKPKHWDIVRGRARHIRGVLEYVEMNKRLDKLASIVQRIFMDNNFGAISVEDFKEAIEQASGNYIEPEEEKMPFFEFIEEFIEQEKTKPNAKRGTWKKYVTVFNHLKDFANEIGNPELNYQDITWQLRKDFLNWLYSPPRNHAINNAQKILHNVKRFMKEAHRAGLHDNAIYLEPGFGLKRVKVKNKVRLSFDELEALSVKLDLSDKPRLERIRDLFIVGCYTGLHFSDWHKIGRDQIIVDDGAELLELMTQKTSEPIVIPLLPELKEVLNKYDYRLPRITIQKFNEYIKEVCQLAISDSKFFRIYSESGKVHSEKIEKWKKVSSHAARRSFATNFWELGIPAPVLMQITGHSTEKQFFEYIDVNQYEVAKRFAREVALRRREKVLGIR